MMKLCLQDEEMSLLDKSCLHLAVRKKDKIETVTFQVGHQQPFLSPVLARLSPDYIVLFSFTKFLFMLIHKVGNIIRQLVSICNTGVPQIIQIQNAYR